MFLLEDPDDLARMASIGQIRGGDEVRKAGLKRWKKARELESLAAVFAQGDPWSAWDTLGGRKPRELWDQCAQLIEKGEESEPEQTEQKPELDELPPKPAGVAKEVSPATEAKRGFAEPVVPSGDTAPRIIPPPRTATSSPPASPAPPAPEKSGARFPQETHPTLVPAFPQESHPTLVPGEVIAFPVGQRGQQGGAAAALRMETVASPKDRTEGPRTRRMFPWVFGGLATVGILSMLAIQSHVRSTAMWVSPRRPAVVDDVAPSVKENPAAEELASVQADEVEPMVETETPSVLRDAAEELRNAMSTGVIDMMGRPDDLSTALLVELSRMKLGPVKVQAEVLAWGGAKNDMPEAAEIHVLLQSKGELEWELGAVGLVVGKYAQFYGLEVARLQVSLQSEDGTLKRLQIDPELAREFYRNRIDLFGYLRGL